MRTTIRLNDHLLTEAKRYAAETRRTLTDLIADALREVLARRRAVGKKPKRVRLPTFQGDGLRPGVDLDNNAVLLDLMDETDGPFRH